MGDALVLSYHAVSEDWDAPLAVSPAMLERQLELLLRRGYRGVRFGEAVSSGTPELRMAVTFDDAYASLLDRALPLLERLRVPGTVFVPTNFPDHPARPMAWPGIDHWVGGPHESELLPLSWDQLGLLAEAGWEVGSHTRSHPHLPSVGDDVLADELAGSRDECERRLGVPCVSLAYPYGAWDARVARAAELAGYRAGGSLLASKHRQRSPAAERSRPLGWPRIGIYRRDDMRRFRLKVSRTTRLLRTRGWHGRGKQALGAG